jgi:voltage-gated potassium channel Kch
VFWNVLYQALTPNPVDPTTFPPLFMVVTFGVTLGSLFLVSILIGILSNEIEGRVDALRRGRSKALENEHTVILGWSHQVFTIISELVIANENRKSGAAIVVLADKDKVEMEDEIRSRIPITKNTRVICRSGDPIEISDLEIVSPHTARSIIVLPPDEEDPDIFVIKTILAITNNPNRRARPYHIVTQLREETNLDVMKMIGGRDDVQAVLVGDLIARMVAQTSRQSGLSMVYTELMNFGGDEIYFTEMPASLVGKTYSASLLAYEDSCVMGLKRADGIILFNPPAQTDLRAGDKLFALSRDDDTVKLSGLINIPIDQNAIRSKGKAHKPAPEKCLVLGWNRSGATIICELDNYVTKGSQVTVVSDVPNVEKSVRDHCGKLASQKVTILKGDATDRALLTKLNAAEYDHVIVLANEGLDIQEADAKTLVTLLNLRNISEADATPFSIVSEMLDLRNRQLAEVTNVDDFVVSEHLVSLMMSQLSEDADLFAIFADIFDPEGSEIYLKPVTDYVETGKPVNFYTVVESASRRDQTAIGYRIMNQSSNAETSYGVHTNPKKSEMITFSPEDKIILAAEQ